MNLFLQKERNVYSVKKSEDCVRIAQIVGKWNGGGVEAVVMNYYRYIDRNKIQFDFICDSDSTNIPYGEIESMGGRIFTIAPYQHPFKYHFELKKVLKKENYKIVHSHISTMSVFSLFAAFCARVPFRIVHAHSTSNKLEKKRNLMKQILRPLSKLFANRYVCCSELAGKWLFGKKTYDKGKVFLLNNAIEVDKFLYNEKMRIKKRKELKIDNDTLVIGNIGRFVEQKNHKFLIDIFKEVHGIRKNSVLLLIGQGPLLNDIKRKVDEYKLGDYVIFLGQRNDAHELYQAMDVFVLPSLYEGLPVVGVEAQAAGLMCVLSDSMTQETKVLNSTVFMSLLNDSKEWANQVLRLLGNNRIDTSKEMTKRGFNIKKEARKLENMYIELGRNVK